MGVSPSVLRYDIISFCFSLSLKWSIWLSRRLNNSAICYPKCCLLDQQITDKVSCCMLYKQNKNILLIRSTYNQVNGRSNKSSSEWVVTTSIIIELNCNILTMITDVDMGFDTIHNYFPCNENHTHLLQKHVQILYITFVHKFTNK